MRIVVATGGFDPLHAGHIRYLEAARALGERLVVGVNSDAWLARKKGKPFMDIADRLAVVSSLRFVDEAITFEDADGSASDAIRKVRSNYPDATIVFANGGDRTPGNIPEMACGVSGVEFAFGVGGEDKINSSSSILARWR
jgi:cytidyltransferase-like protein